MEKVSRKIDVAGLNIDAITKVDLLLKIAERIERHEKTFVVTPYSEFLYASLRSKQVRELLNSADFSIADGVGIFWAHLFMSQPLVSKNYYLKIVELWWQVFWTGASVLLNPKSLYKVIPEKIVGADLVWNLAEMAEKNNFSVYLLGARGDVAKTVAEKFQNQLPNLRIVGTSNKEVSDPTILEDVNAVKPDMLLVAFNRLTSEQWIADNLPQLETSFAIGLGGTFDYIAGVKIAPPQFIRAIGLEWFYRLITQPTRVKRIFEATWGLVLSLVRVKMHDTFPLRSNACAVVVNSQNEILLCEKVKGRFGNTLVNYWQFPQGGIDNNESIVEGAARELFEETGVQSVKLIGVAKYNNVYFWSNAIHPLITPRNFRFRGQQQGTAFFKFFGDNSEIQIDMEEFVGYKWVPIDQIMEVIHEERRPHAIAVLAELSNIQLN